MMLLVASLSGKDAVKVALSEVAELGNAVVVSFCGTVAGLGCKVEPVTSAKCEVRVGAAVVEDALAKPSSSVSVSFLGAGCLTVVNSLSISALASVTLADVIVVISEREVVGGLIVKGFVEISAIVSFGIDAVNGEICAIESFCVMNTWLGGTVLTGATTRIKKTNKEGRRKE